MLRGLLAGTAAGALWGVVFIAPRMAPSLSPVELTAGRFLSYGLLSLALMLLRPSAWPTLRQAFSALGLSVLGFTGYYLMLVLAIRDAGTAVPSLIIGTIPIWMVLLGKPAGLRWSGLLPGLALTLLGLGLMVHAELGPNVRGITPGQDFWRGIAFALASMVCWTAFGLLNAAWLKKNPHITATAWANWLGVATGLGALLVWFVAGKSANELMAGVFNAYYDMIYIVTGVGSAWLATIFWNIASQRLSVSLCGQLIVSETLFALFYSFLWDGQWPSALQVTACGLFVAGILASVRAHRA
ncbi:MAG: DMT family transporter [Chitinophagaceae bacterium]|nr:DMT family transporter [Polaromonas sp.]